MHGLHQNCMKILRKTSLVKAIQWINANKFNKWGCNHILNQKVKKNDSF